MRNTILKFCAAAAVTASFAAFAADPPTPGSAPPGSAVKDCNGLAPDAKKECQKVAAQMDQTALGKPSPPSGNPPDAGANALHHSSPIMQTPEERAAAKATAKGQDPKKAIEKLHAKEGQPN